MHRISDIVYHPGQFRLASGRMLQGNAASFGPGAVTWDLYRALDKYGQIAVGGNCKTVSPGGYITGGGHSILSPSRGLAVDNVIEIEVVTADGKIQKVNQDMNTDLFWAIRGVSPQYHTQSCCKALYRKAHYALRAAVLPLAL